MINSTIVSTKRKLLKLLERSKIIAKFILNTQQPKPKKLGEGVLSIERNGDANFFSCEGEYDSRILSTITRIKVEFAGRDGIMFSGFEQVGIDKTGKPKFRYQEWWLIYV
jgi:hypothetical protein